MVQFTVPKDLGLYVDTNDPTEVGDIKLVTSTLLSLDNCDSIVQWSVHSGAGVTIALENSIVKEGTGSIKVTIPHGVTAIVKATKASGSWDLSAYRFLRAWLQTPKSLSNMYLRFGEAAYNEQSTSSFVLSSSDGWKLKMWDISGITPTSRDGVTIFAVEALNSWISPQTLYIDLVAATEGYNQLKAKDEERVITIYPKIYMGTYSGDGIDGKTVVIPRKGTPKMVRIITTGTGQKEVIKDASFTTTTSQAADGTYLASDGIKSISDGSFTLGTNALVNSNGVLYYFTVFWQD